MNKQAIGVFDSGFGGLTVLKELRKVLPHENVIYFGDTARIPYGTKSKETIIKYSKQNIRFLMRHHVKAIVVACNTASALAVPEVEALFDIPLIGVVEPGARGAVRESKTGRIGVIGTTGTVRSGAYQEAIGRLHPQARIQSTPCPLFVQIVEEGWQDTEIARLTAEKYLEEMKDADVDAMVMGCTHYPILEKTLKQVMGDTVQLVNPARETALAVKKLLEADGMLAGEDNEAEYRFYVSDDPEKFRETGRTIVSIPMKRVKKISIENY
jgi:glutamate racemase